MHPEDPDTLYVAAFGHAFGPNAERGVYRSTDGGETWDLVLHEDERSGAIDIAMDPTNPRILFAATWEAHRHFWTLSSGGPGSKLYRSTDGGDNWTEVSGQPGFAKACSARSASPSRRAPAASGRWLKPRTNRPASTARRIMARPGAR